jgi:hypothetical protein
MRMYFQSLSLAARDTKVFRSVHFEWRDINISTTLRNAAFP